MVADRGGDGCRRNLVQAALAEGLAAQQAPQGQGGSAHRAVSGNGYCCVVRTGGLKSASTRAERVHGGRQPSLIEAESGEQEPGDHAGETTGSCVASRAASSRAASARACVR